MSKLIIIISLFFLPFYVSAQSGRKSTAPKSESVQDSTKRFSLADGKYVGVNPKAPQIKNSRGNVVKKKSNPREINVSQQQRFTLDIGKDTGVGSEYRSERYQSLENRNKARKAILKPNPQSDTLSRQRIILQDGKYVGVGPKKSKDK